MDVNVLLNDHESFHEYPPESKTIRFSAHGASPDGLQITSLSCLGAFGYLNDMLYQSNIQYQSLSNTITALPMKTPHQGLKDLKNEYNGPFCHDDDLLLLKATSKLVLDCMQNTVVLLRDIKETQSDNQFQNRTYVLNIIFSLKLDFLQPTQQFYRAKWWVRAYLPEKNRSFGVAPHRKRCEQCTFVRKSHVH